MSNFLLLVVTSWNLSWQQGCSSE